MERENEKNTTTGKPDVNFCFHRKHIRRIQYTHKQYHGSEKCCHGRFCYEKQHNRIKQQCSWIFYPFDNNNYLAKLNPKNNPIKNTDNLIIGFTGSISLDKKNGESYYEKPIEVSLEGSNPDVIASYLNDLASAANEDIINELLNLIQQRIDIRLEDISKEISLLSQYDNREKVNKIKELSYALDMAKALGIKNNNLSDLKNNTDSSLVISISSGKSLPKWYLLGEIALKREIELLKNNKYSFIPKVVKLEVEKIKLNSFNLSPVDINAMQLNQ